MTSEESFPEPSPRLDSGRYRLLAQLGEGGMGLVYRARDTTLSRDVALKTLRAWAPNDLYQLKKEFRALSSLLHPNLVQLYDLVVHGDDCFFTMELIQGVDLLRHVRRPADAAGPSWHDVDEDRLRDSFRQLATGLHALHGFGRVHRDVKPANVLVANDGRVVLLDFGLASTLSSQMSRHSRIGVVDGTLAYMSPEQAVGADVSPASDWYSMGLVLYEALTGRLPFEGPALVSAMERTHATPRPPQEVASEIPRDLAALTMELLRTKPEDRPDGTAVLERLQASSAARAHTITDASAPATDDASFVGRTAEVAALRAALDGARRDGPVTLCVGGPSGIGKTTLVKHFLAAATQDSDAVLLRASCHPQESVPFQAVDGAVDDLARFLAHQPDARVDALLPHDVGALARVFPVLARVPAIASVASRDTTSPEPLEMRRRAFAALRDLLVRIADRHPLLLWIDDFQWADPDGVALLRAVLERPGAPHALVLLSLRASDRDTGALGILLDDPLVGDPQRLEVAPLSAEDSRELARRLIAAEGASADDATLDGIARESGGSPFFASELALHAARGSANDIARAGRPIRVDELMAQRVAALPQFERHLLETVCVAGEPMSEELLHRVHRGHPGLDRVLAGLRAERLLRPALLDGRPAIDTYHDRVRESVVQALPTERYRALHGELAAALASLEHPDPQRLVEHYLQANDLAQAAEHAFASAERASTALAFAQAARLYRRALELGVSSRPAWLVRARLATTLVNLGRGGEAASLYEAAARELAATSPDDPEVSHLERQAAEHYLRCGQHAEGLAAMRRVLDDARLPWIESTPRVLASLLLNRARLSLRHAIGDRTPAPPPSADDRKRLEVCWSAGLGLGVSDMLRAAEFQTRHALLALRSGDPAHVARALSIEALLAVWEGGSRKRRRAATLRVEAERLARLSGEPNVEAYALVLRAVGAFLERRLRDAAELADRAEELCRDRCVGAAWELANVDNIAVTSRALACDLDGLAARLERVLREARERNDQYALLMCRVGFCSLVWLAADDPGEARRQADAALAQPFPATYTWPVYQGAVAHASVDLYLGDPRSALGRIDAAWRTLQSSGMLRFQMVRIELRDLRARCALAIAVDGSCTAAERARRLRDARKETARIAREDLGWATPVADALQGGIAAASGDAAAARAALDRAAFGFEHLGMGLHAASVRLRLATLLDTGEGARVSAEQRAWLAGRGVREPDRLAAAVAPAVRNA